MRVMSQSPKTISQQSLQHATVHAGWAYTRGGGSALFSSSAYKKRYFVITVGKRLKYYKDPEDYYQNRGEKGWLSCLGMVVLERQGTKTIGKKDIFTFTIQAKEGSCTSDMHCACETNEEREQMLATIDNIEELAAVRELCNAAKDGISAIVKALVCRPDVTLHINCTLFGRTPLDYAVDNDKVEAAAVLRAHGAVCSLKSVAQKGMSDEVEASIAAGQDVNARDSLHQETPLHKAARRGHTKTVEALVHANADVCAQDKYNKYTPLHWAVVRGHVETIEALVQAKADVGAQDKWKYTPLHWAAYKGHAKMIEPLVNAKADICAQNRYGKTPLDVAVDNKNEAAFITLAEKGMMDEVSAGIVAGHESICSENPAVQPEKVLSC